MILIYSLVTLLIIGISYSLYVFPWVTKYLHLFVYSFEATNEDKILFFSDTHIKNEKSNLSILKEFILSTKPRYIVVAGDFLDERRVMSHEEFTRKLNNALKKLGIHELEQIDFFYVMSLSSHDPIIKEDYFNYQFDKKMIHIVKGALLLKTMKERYFVMHGDYFSRNGAIAGVINIIMKRIFNKQLWVECFLKQRLSLSADTWLIMGHTHIPGINSTCKVANSGAWSSHIGRAFSNTILLVDQNSSIKLLTLNKSSSP